MIGGSLLKHLHQLYYFKKIKLNRVSALWRVTNLGFQQNSLTATYRCMCEIHMHIYTYKYIFANFNISNNW